MRTRIKVCCIATAEEAEIAIASGADAIGFVGARPPSARTIPDLAIAAIAKTVPAAVSTFLLTTEQTAEAIAAQVELTRANTVQILNHLSAFESERLAAVVPWVHRVQVIHVEGPEALELIPRYSAHVNAFLLDSGKPNAPVAEFGGTGRQHDWDVSAEFVRQSPRKTFLAGGLSASNVVAAIHRVRPFGVDLCSGVRTDGRLDRQKLTDFVKAVRGADGEVAAVATTGTKLTRPTPDLL